MHNGFVPTDDTYNAAAEAAALALAHSGRARIEFRCSNADRANLARSAALLGCTKSDLLRGFSHMPIDLQRLMLESAELENPRALLVDNVTLMQGVNQIRRAGYNIDYTLHALNTLLAKPGLREERKFELLRNAAENSMRAANGFAATREVFTELGRLARLELSVQYPARLR